MTELSAAPEVRDIENSELPIQPDNTGTKEILDAGSDKPNTSNPPAAVEENVKKKSRKPKTKVDQASETDKPSKPIAKTTKNSSENSGTKSNQSKPSAKQAKEQEKAVTNNNRNERRHNSQRGKAQQQTQRLLASMASKSSVVENDKAQQFSSINTTITLRSYSLARYMTSEVQNIMIAASDVIPFIQATSRVAGYQELFTGFTKESIAVVKEVSERNLEMIQIITESDERIKMRLDAVTMSDPVSFKLVFLNPFFWDYIVMLGDADKALHQIEKIGLTGALEGDVEQLKKEVLDAVRETFRALQFLSKIRTRRDRDSPIRLDQFKTIQANYRTRISSVVGDDDDLEAEPAKPSDASDNSESA
ncbi:hypothetical protein OH460_09190 [Vibrio sp. Makdt]|uniref:hypothetical protein n=1 Tax=Vibrio sp. Makdt TaxID=2998828 RepID=UPI0022CD7ADB|nr:hypothetical protein [Vibrio sp. Makdt]MDA0152477.1 hypothetical protein [Vibrio sp. Makdt]